MPTPALQFWIRHHEVDGGVMITGSHNPAEYNGVKVVWKDGIELSREQEIKVEKAYFGSQIVLARWNRLGETHELRGIVDEYVAAIIKHVNAQAIRKKRYRAVVDAANSVGGVTGPKLLRNLGCGVTGINSKMDGSFPRRLPEPRPENLGGLSSTVKSVGAHLGVAFDSDADRVIFADEKGRIVSGDEGFGLIEKHFLMENHGEKIVTSISSSTMIEDIAKEYGGQVVWTKIGSITVSKTMKKLNAKLGGEEYGGIFYGPHQPVRDGAMATALVLGIMARTGQSLSELLGALPQYFIAKARIACSEQLKKKVLEQLFEQVKGLRVSTLDGIKIWFDDKSAILVRPSGTEPVYRLYSEAKTAERAKQLIQEYGSRVRKIVEIVSGPGVS
jgi:phosphomannomutase/phosphoglucomutase